MPSVYMAVSSLNNDNNTEIKKEVGQVETGGQGEQEPEGSDQHRHFRSTLRRRGHKEAIPLSLRHLPHPRRPFLEQALRVQDRQVLLLVPRLSRHANFLMSQDYTTARTAARFPAPP